MNMHTDTKKFCIHTKYMVQSNPILRGHLGDKKKWSCKTGDLLKEDQFL